MTSIEFEDIYSRFYGKVTAYDFLELSNSHRDELMCSWLHSVKSKPHVRKLFSKISIDDDKEKLEFESNYVVDEDSDKEFVIEVFAIGMIIEWITPKINNVTNIAQMFTGNESKFFSQSNHLSEICNLRDSLVKEQRNLISDRGYFWNTYLDGES